MRHAFLVYLSFLFLSTGAQAAGYELTDSLIQFLGQVDLALQMHTPQQCLPILTQAGPYSYPSEELLMDGWRMACTTTLTCVAEKLETSGL
ncbi:MAG: hypothetical protein EBQ96_01715 [Proteobacteria bacterium]|nr:hypothetical protein [Pseudomonadota bacterium]